MRKAAGLKLILILGALAFLLSLPAWSFFTGWMSQNQEVSIGKDIASSYESKYGAVEDPWVTGVGMKLVPYCGRTDLQYHFKVLQTDEPNAMSIMGGFVDRVRQANRGDGQSAVGDAGEKRPIGQVGSVKLPAVKIRRVPDHGRRAGGQRP